MDKLKFKSKIFDFDEGKLGYDDTEERLTIYGHDSKKLPVIVCLPGAGSLRSQYNYISPMLSNEGFRVICLDIRGLDNGSTKWKSCSVYDVAQDVIKLMKYLNISDRRGAIIMAHGETSLSAIHIASEEINMIKGIILISPIFGTIKRLKNRFKYDVSMPRYIENWMKWYKSLYGKSFEELPPQHVSYIKMVEHMMSDHDRYMLYQQYIQSSIPLENVNMKNIECPIYIASAGLQIPLKNSNDIELLRQLLNYKVKMIESKVYEDSGHFIHVESPDSLSKNVSVWIMRHYTSM